MRLDELTSFVSDRVDEFVVARDEQALYGIDVDALWDVVRGIDYSTAPQGLLLRAARAFAALGALHHHRYLQRPRERLVDLAKAVLCLEEVADDANLVPHDLRPVIGRFTDGHAKARLGVTLLSGVTAKTDPALLDAAIGLLDAATHVLTPVQLVALGRAFRLRHERDGDPDDLDMAITTGEKAVEAVAGPGRDAFAAWSELALSYWSGHLLHHDPEALRLSIDLSEEVLAHTSATTPPPHHLAAAYLRHYAITGRREHLDRAVQVAEHALQINPHDVAALSALTSAMAQRHYRNGDDADLDAAVEHGEHLTTLISADEPAHGEHVGHIVSALLQRHARTGSTADLDRAVNLAEGALRLLPDEDRHRSAVNLGLAEALHLRHESTGSATDLDRAITLVGWVLADALGDRRRAEVRLAALLLDRYDLNGVLHDVNTAIELGDSPSVPEPSAEWLSLLSDAYGRRHFGTGEPTDLDRAFDLGERALTATAENDPELATREARLATTHWRRHRVDSDGPSLRHAVALLTSAVTRRPADHPDVSRWYAKLATLHYDQYRLTGDPKNVEAAVGFGEKALTGFPDSHPGRTRVLADLCAAHVERFLSGGAAPDVQHLIEAVLGATGTTPVDRVAAHHWSGVLAHATGQVDLAAHLLRKAVDLLPSVAPREARWADRQHRVGTHGGLVSAAVAAHCAAGDPVGAIAVAEAGRAILLVSEANTRIDSSALRDRNPHLADRFRWVCERLNDVGFPLDERRAWWEQYDSLLEEIRAVPGLDGFGGPPRLADLAPALNGGCVVLVNVSKMRADAILVRADRDPVVIPLAGLRLDETEAHVAAIQGMQLHDPAAEEVVRGVLRWLWDSVVAPVVAHLGEGGPHRVWWLPTGVLGLLPLHAAEPAEGPGAFDVLVSSYIPSLRALRKAHTQPTGSHEHRIVVSVPKPQRGETDSLSPLPGVGREVKSLGGEALVDEDATAEAVLAALPGTAIAHFACHAVVDLADQSNSGLELHDRRLRLPEIGGLHLTGSEIAYLSACSTANYGTRYADEVLHVASVFQLAGFRHVIAGLWPLRDRPSSRAADLFYRELSSADRTASVLHSLNLRLREQYKSYPTQWAALIHSGP